MLDFDGFADLDAIAIAEAELRAKQRGEWVATPIVDIGPNDSRVTGYGVSRWMPGVEVALCDSDGVRMTFSTESAAREIAADANKRGSA